MSKQNSTSIKNLFSVKRAAKFMQIEQVKNWATIERVFFLSSIYKFAMLAMFCKFNNKFALFCEQMR